MVNTKILFTEWKVKICLHSMINNTTRETSTVAFSKTVTIKGLLLSLIRWNGFFIPDKITAWGQISAQSNTSLCVQFLDEENNGMTIGCL